MVLELNVKAIDDQLPLHRESRIGITGVLAA